MLTLSVSTARPFMLYQKCIHRPEGDTGLNTSLTSRATSPGCLGDEVSINMYFPKNEKNRTSV